MISIQKLIQEAKEKEHKEGGHFFSLNCGIASYGKEDQCWSALLRVIRAAKMDGVNIKFFLKNGEELIDESPDVPIRTHTNSDYPTRLPMTSPIILRDM